MRSAGLALVWILACLIGRAGASESFPRAREISPQAAYAMAKARGRIADVGIAGDLDLSRLESPAASNGVDLVNVIVRGRVVVRDQGPPIAVRFQAGELSAIDASGARLRQALDLDQTRVRDHANFEGTIFGGPVRLTQAPAGAGRRRRRARRVLPPGHAAHERAHSERADGVAGEGLGGGAVADLGPPDHGYGTKLGRIVLVALGCWLLLALPLAFTKGLLVSLPAASPNPDDKRPAGDTALFRPLPALDTGAYCEVNDRARMAMAYRYTFALMFKLPGNRTRPVGPLGSPYAWYLQLLWWVGSLLLALIAITLANTSPAIQAVIGKLVV